MGIEQSDFPGDLDAAQVVDPKDYNKTKRFQEIHSARQRVADAVENLEYRSSDGGSHPLSARTRLAYLVSLYILELQPLIEQSSHSEGELVPDEIAAESLTEFAHEMGLVHEADDQPHQPVPVQQSIAAYAAANRFIASVGLDLEIREQVHEAEFDYSDIIDDED